VGWNRKAENACAYAAAAEGGCTIIRWLTMSTLTIKDMELSTSGVGKKA